MKRGNIHEHCDCNTNAPKLPQAPDFKPLDKEAIEMTGAYLAINASAVSAPSHAFDQIDYASESAAPARDFLLARSDFQIRLGSSASGQRSHVSMLIERLYAWRGLLTETPTNLDDRPNRLTLIASRGQTVFGTVSLGLDSPEGLNADALYNPQIERLRRRGARVCELTRLAIDPAFNSKEVLASIFHLSYIFSRLIHEMSDLLIEVNPRHAPFYRRMLGFQVAGEEHLCERVNAPAVLLHLPLEYADRQIALHAGQNGGNDRSLYSHFLSPQEQSGLVRRIQKDPVHRSFSLARA